MYNICTPSQNNGLSLCRSKLIVSLTLSTLESSSYAFFFCFIFLNRFVQSPYVFSVLFTCVHFKKPLLKLGLFALPSFTVAGFHHERHCHDRNYKRPFVYESSDVGLWHSNGLFDYLLHFASR